MKKVKLMLVSLSVLAVVGGALAFTSNTSKSGSLFCTIDYVSGGLPAFCPTPARLKNPVGSELIATAPTNGDPDAPCVGVACESITNSTIE